MEDRHSVKLSRLLAFDCAGIERLSAPQPNSCVLLSGVATPGPARAQARATWLCARAING